MAGGILIVYDSKECTIGECGVFFEALLSLNAPLILYDDPKLFVKHWWMVLQLLVRVNVFNEFLLLYGCFSVFLLGSLDCLLHCLEVIFRLRLLGCCSLVTSFSFSWLTVVLKGV